ncbi:MAG TPA: tyrosine--tRNA ligase [Bacillota bacterium]|nr:tyrosine--tRNA ligase [Bacillota bacterium]
MMGVSNTYELLEQRGYIYQSTDPERVRELVNGKPMVFYLGIDPTADSLHIGHFFALMMFRYLQEAGHKGILLIGGATALVGDPSGKSDMRRMLSKQKVAANLEEVKELAKKFIITTGENAAIITNNAEWIAPYSYIDFMRDIGIHFNVNKMLSAETYSNRIKEGGLTFLEMAYMPMQAYDFVHLNREFGCVLQIGGSDQWGNIVAGSTLNRKLNNVSEDERAYDKDLFGLTCPLLMTKDGKKMGKTESGTLWVAREKTTPYDFYQYFYNVDDENVELLLKLFTRLELDRIKSVCSTDIVAAKKLMAYEITKLVHGKEEADKVVDAVSTLFGKNDSVENLPFVKVPFERISNGAKLVDLLVEVGFLPSRSEARRMIDQGAITLDGEKVGSIDQTVGKSDFGKGYIIVKRGKKNFLKIEV